MTGHSVTLASWVLDCKTDSSISALSGNKDYSYTHKSVKLLITCLYVVCLEIGGHLCLFSSCITTDLEDNKGKRPFNCYY